LEGCTTAVGVAEQGKTPCVGVFLIRTEVVERETGFEPATFCLGSEGLRLGRWLFDDLGHAVADHEDGKLPRRLFAVTMRRS